MSNKLNQENLKPFINRRVINSFNFKELIVQNTDKTKLLPLIPSIYFKTVVDDNIGSRIINNYYNIKFNLKKLNIIKNFIISILESSKYDLEKITISREKYKLFTENLFFNSPDDTNNFLKSLDTFVNLDNFKDFVKKYSDNKYGLFKKNLLKDVPNFFKIFQKEYQNNPDSKTYFIKLFKKYIAVRNLLIEYIENNCGILAFSFLFDLSNTQFFAKMKAIEKKKLNDKKKNNNKTLPYNNFILYNKNSLKNNEFDFKIGDVLTKDSSANFDVKYGFTNVKSYSIESIDFNSLTPYTLKITFTTSVNPPTSINITKNELNTYFKSKKIYNFEIGNFLKKSSVNPFFDVKYKLKNVKSYIIYNIDFRNSPIKPYTIQIVSNDPTIPIKFINIDEKELNDYFNIIEKINKNLVNKIHSFDLLYVNVANQQYYKNEYNNNINMYYFNLTKSLNNYVGNGFSNNLYHVLVNEIEADFNMIHFIFHYTDQILFSKVVDLQLMAKNYILTRINNFEKYYDAYMEWYELFIGLKERVTFDYDATPDSNFKLFFDRLFDESVMGKKTTL